MRYFSICSSVIWVSLLFVPCAWAQSTDDAAKQLAATQKENELLRQEITALREQIELRSRKTKLQDRKVSGAQTAAPDPPSKPLYMRATALNTAPASGVPPAAVSWTGFYAGLNGGYGWGSETDTNIVTGVGGGGLGGILAVAGPQSTFFDYSNGVFGGLQVGHNWEFGQWYVTGVEADFDWSRIKGSSTTLIEGNPMVTTIPGTTLTGSRSLDWFGTVRARLGFTPIEPLLLYGTGGFAYGQLNNYAAINTGPAVGYIFGTLTCNAGTICEAASQSIAYGWAAGGGFSYAVTDHVLVGAEYLFMNLGEDTLTLVSPLGGGSSTTAKQNAATYNIVRAKVDYKF